METKRPVSFTNHLVAKESFLLGETLSESPK